MKLDWAEETTIKQVEFHQSRQELGSKAELELVEEGSNKIKMGSKEQYFPFTQPNTGKYSIPLENFSSKTFYTNELFYMKQNLNKFFVIWGSCVLIGEAIRH